ncbi:MAG: thiamine phosphate synthase, partial [Planctomycetaceae bacterium]
QTLRILDAAANRAREGLRVVEDFVRLILDDAHLSRQLKELRHQLSSLMTAVSDVELIQARDTRGDVGTSISTQQEMSRSNAVDVLKAGLKRAQEAVRTLEEFSKVVASDIVQNDAAVPDQFAQIRYGLYTLEKSILTAVEMHKRLQRRSLYLLLTVELCRLNWETVLRESIAGGIDIVQVREKSMTGSQLIAHLRQVREITRSTGTMLIINDRPDLAVLANCDGVHIGQDDLSVRDVRKIVGPDRLIGVSTHTIEQARQAVLDGAGYLGVGPVFRSQTKSFAEFAGLEFVKEVSTEISLPAFPIGGIAGSHLTEVLQAGATRAAVSSTVCNAEDPRAAAAALARGLVSQ